MEGWREEGCNLVFTGSLSKWLQQQALCQAKTKRQDLCPSLTLFIRLFKLSSLAAACACSAWERNYPIDHYSHTMSGGLQKAHRIYISYKNDAEICIFVSEQFHFKNIYYFLLFDN